MYLRGLLLVLSIYTLYGALVLQYVELQRILGDAAVRDIMLESAILFVQKVCNCTALCSSVESLVSDSCRKGSTDEYLVIYYDYM